MGRAAGDGFRASARLWIVVALGGLLGGIAGCATYRAEPVDPAVMLRGLDIEPAKLFATTGAEGAGRTEGATAAFDPSDGWSEAELVAAALEGNQELRIERARIGESAALLIDAGRWPNPSLARVWRPGVAGTAGHSVEGELIFEIPRPGEIPGRKAAVRARADAARAELAAREWLLVAAVRKQRLRVLAATRRRQLLLEELALRQSALDLVASRRRTGEGTELSVGLVQLERDDLVIDELATAGEEQAARLELNRLLGLRPGDELRLEDAGEPIRLAARREDPSDEEIDQRLLAGRFELTAKQAEYRAAEAELRQAIAKQYPGVGLGHAWAREDDGSMFRGLATDLVLPLFDRNQGEIREKRSARARVRAELQGLLHTLRAAAHEARARVRIQARIVDRYEQEVLPGASRVREFVGRGLRARDLDFLSAGLARREALGVLRKYQQALLELEEARIDLDAALGSSEDRP